MTQDGLCRRRFGPVWWSGGVRRGNLGNERWSVLVGR